MTAVSSNFTLEELTRSQIAARLGIANTPNATQLYELTTLANSLLEPIRAGLGVPLHIDSGFRSLELNLRVGGAKNSAHMDGRAADFIPIGIPLREAFNSIRAGAFPFDQLIIECNAWLHISIPAPGANARGQCLVASGSPGAWVYTSVDHEGE